jgi:hypothetical protein
LLSSDAPAQQAGRLLAEAEAEAGVEDVFVRDQDGRLLGGITPSARLRRLPGGGR